MLQWFLSVLSAPVFNTIVEAYKAKLAAAKRRTSSPSILPSRKSKARLRPARKPPRSSSRSRGRCGHPMIRPLAALPVVIYIWKVIVYDKVLGLGTTDTITGDVGTWAGVIITTYFGGRTIEKVARIFRRAAPDSDRG